MSETTPTDATTCEFYVADFREDERLHPCLSAASKEVFDLSGAWRPACDRHAFDYPDDRRRAFVTDATIPKGES